MTGCPGGHWKQQGTECGADRLMTSLCMEAGEQPKGGLRLQSLVCDTADSVVIESHFSSVLAGDGSSVDHTARSKQ